jgi:hypothetical protein
MNTNRLTQVALSLVLIMFTVAASNYMKNSVYRLEDELKSIKQNIQSDEEAIHVLNAEWSKLNNPSRLRNLVSNHIALNPLKAEQIINYSALPFGYETGDSKKDIARKNIAAYAQNNRDLKKLTAAQR